jgi:hypothetical protein
MGFKAIDLVPINSSGVTALIPAAKNGYVKVFQVSRTDTTATVKCVLPADSSILGFLIYGAASNAGTTANLNIGTTVAATELVNAQDVKTTGGLIIPTATINPANMPQLENVPNGPDIQLWAKYAETGTVSSAGGPYKVVVWYVR